MQNGKEKRVQRVVTVKEAAVIIMMTLVAVVLLMSNPVFAEAKVTIKDIADTSYLRDGEARQLIPDVKGEGKGEITKITFKSSKPSVASVSDEGVVTGKKPGTASVTVKAVIEKSEGEEVVKDTVSKKIELRVTKCRHVSHKGLQNKAPANSEQAYIFAGKAHFWGAEGDVRVSKKDSKGNYEIYICHDDNLKSVCGVNKCIHNMTPKQISALRITHGKNAKKYNQKILTLDKFLDVCLQYDMVPYLDMKASYGDGAAKKIVKGLAKRGMLEDARLVGYYTSSMHKIRKYAKKEYGVTPKCLLNAGRKPPKGRSPYQQVKFAHSEGFEGASVHYSVMSTAIEKYCKKHDMEVNLWTYDAGQKGKILSQYKKYGAFSDMDNRMVE